MKDIAFWVNFFAENSDKLPKLGLEGKISWAHTLFTLEPTALATLVHPTSIDPFRTYELTSRGKNWDSWGH